MKYYFLLFIISVTSCFTNTDTIKIKGCDIAVNLAVLLAEDFHSKSPELLVPVSVSGSGLGIASLLKGNADIANSSRNIQQTELDLFKRKNIEMDSFVFAQDAIAFVASEKIPIECI